MLKSVLHLPTYASLGESNSQPFRFSGIPKITLVRKGTLQHTRKYPAHPSEREPESRLPQILNHREQRTSSSMTKRITDELEKKSLIICNQNAERGSSAKGGYLETNSTSPNPQLLIPSKIKRMLYNTRQTPQVPSPKNNAFADPKYSTPKSLVNAKSFGVVVKIHT